MKPILFCLLLCSLCSAQMGGNATMGGQATAGAASSGGGATADFAYRTSQAGVLRYNGLNTGTNIPTSASNQPVGTGFPDRAVNGDGSTNFIQDSSLFLSGTASLKIIKPADSDSAGPCNVSGQSCSADFDYTLDGATLFASGSEFYVQYREYFDANRIIYQSPTDDGMKDFILTGGDRWINATPTWANTTDCSDLQFVSVDSLFSGYPIFYYGCNGAGTYDGGQLNLIPQRSGDYLYQNAQGCLRSAAGGATAGVAISSVTRSSGVVTVVTSSPHGLTTGNEAKVWGIGAANPASTSDQTFNGFFPNVTVDSSTQYHYSQGGPNASGGISGSSLSYKIDLTHCWRPSFTPEWTTRVYHFKIGTPYVTDSHNYHRNTLLEVFAAHENGPYSKVLSIPDFDPVVADNGDLASSVRPSVSPASTWWALHGVTPGFGRHDMLMYQTNRCPSSASVTSWTRTTNSVTITFNIAGSTWANGAGGQCANPGDTIVVTGIAAINGTWVLTGGSSTTATFAQTGSNSGPNSVSGTVQEPVWVVNCNGVPCDMQENFAEFIVSTNLPPTPGEFAGTVTTPTPPTNLAITAYNNSTGSTTVSFVANDNNATSYKVYTAAGDIYGTDYTLGSSGDPFTLNATDTVTNTTRYTSYSYTFTFPATNAIYSAYVKACNAAGCSAPSNKVQNTPGIPSDVAAASSSTTLQTITWTNQAPQIATTYTVQRCAGTSETGGCTDSGGGWANPGAGTCHGTVSAPASSCTDTDTLTVSNTYVYRVKASDSAGFTTPGTYQSFQNNGYGGNTAAAQLTVIAGSTFATGWNSKANIAAMNVSYPTCQSTDPSIGGISFDCTKIPDYSGGFWDSTRNRAVMFGGGHASTDDNSLQIAGVTVGGTGSFTWLTFPTIPGFIACHPASTTFPIANSPPTGAVAGHSDTDTCTNGTASNPVTRHTVNGLTYDSVDDLYYSGPGQSAVGAGNSTEDFWEYNANTSAWTRRCFQGVNWTGMGWGGGTTTQGLAYDSSAALIRGLSTAGMFTYNPSTHACTTSGSSPAINDRGSAALDTSVSPARWLLLTADNTPTPMILSISTSTGVITHLEGSCTSLTTNACSHLLADIQAPNFVGPGNVFDTSDNSFVIHNSSTARPASVYVCTTNHTTSISCSEDTTGSANGPDKSVVTGMFGRWMKAPGICSTCFMAVHDEKNENQTNGILYVYKR